MTVLDTPPFTLQCVLAAVEDVRIQTNARLVRRRQVELSQYTTPLDVARFMAQLLPETAGAVRLLDAGAGVGSLSAAVVVRLCSAVLRPASIECTAVEIDEGMEVGLAQTLTWLQKATQLSGVPFDGQLQKENFLIDTGQETLFRPEPKRFTHIVLNPPYKKITTATPERASLAARGLDITNLYTAFLDLAVQLLEPGGELVAITPRSFFNGVYYRNFRRRFLGEMTFQRIHLIDSRREAFRENNVLQETVIFRATKRAKKTDTVEVSYGTGFHPDEEPETRQIAYTSLIHKDDSEFFIRVDTTQYAAGLSDQMGKLPATLVDLGLQASTGKVVDFRALHLISTSETGDGQPLIYPGHLSGGQVHWPRPLIGKPNMLLHHPEARRLMVPEGYYVLIKRFSAKEEVRRVSASLYEPEKVHFGHVGFENHLNYIHQNGQGLPRVLALGLCAFLNSSIFDTAFRQFSGHTQVNVTDLKAMRYPPRAFLERLGRRVSLPLPDQETLDILVQEEVFGMIQTPATDARIREARTLLGYFELPKSAQNDRSALTLLALLDLKPDEPWDEAKQPLRGVTPIMTFCREHYGSSYQPNSRESFRKDTLHHWVHESLAEINADDPSRPTNSQKTVYRVSDDLLMLARQYGTPDFQGSLEAYQGLTPRRKIRQMDVRSENLILINYGGDEFTLSPGGQNPLVKAILDEFCPRYAADAELIYVGDTADKNAVKYGMFKKERLADLGVHLEAHGKIPDVMVYSAEKNWLYLIEAVSGHGPFDKTRLEAMQRLFAGSTAGIVYVTAFPDRARFQKYVGVIAWETEVWVAESPEHLIHFNGDRFFGPR